MFSWEECPKTPLDSTLYSSLSLSPPPHPTKAQSHRLLVDRTLYNYDYQMAKVSNNILLTTRGFLLLMSVGSYYLLS